MTKTVTSKFMLAAGFSTVLLTGCGGGGSSTSSTTNVTSPAAGTLDLKSADGAKNMSSSVFDFLDISSDVDNKSLFYNNSQPSSTRTLACTPSGSYSITVSNPDGIASVNDSSTIVSTACATRTATGLSTNTGTVSATITAISGNLATVPTASGVTLTTTTKLSTAADETINTLRYVTNATVTGSTTYTYGHDGKNTAAETDDINSVATDISFLEDGTANNLPFSVAVKVSTACSRVALANTICSKADATISGNLLNLGSFNVTVKSTVPLQYNSNREPVAGTLVITQGTDVASLTFSLANSIPQATITSASGGVQVLKFADFIKISDSLR
jgi:hypothetical protein